jgi:hypothetical protein
MLGETILLAFRIALVWAAGILLAVAVAALLPDKLGFTLIGKETTLFVPFSRAGFWTCVLGALIVTALIVFRAIRAEIGWNTFR